MFKAELMRTSLVIRRWFIKSMARQCHIILKLPHLQLFLASYRSCDPLSGEEWSNCCQQRLERSDHPCVQGPQRSTDNHHPMCE